MALYVETNGHPPPAAQFPCEVRAHTRQHSDEVWEWIGTVPGKYAMYWKGNDLFIGFSEPDIAFEYRLRFT